MDVRRGTVTWKSSSADSRNLGASLPWGSVLGGGKTHFTANAHATLLPHLLAALADGVSEQTDRAKNSPENGGIAATA